MSKAIIDIPEAINVTGRRGRSFYALEAPPAADLGYEGDGAVDVLTGAVYVRGAIAWTETGENFFAGALAAGELAAEKADAANGSATAAAGSENAAGASAVAAAASALAAAASENAAGDSATAAAGSAGAAATSATNAGDSETAAAASASAADDDATQTAADVLSTASNLASAVAAKDLAIAAQAGAETAQAGADATKAAMDVALAAVTDYSDTLGLLTGGAKEIVAAADVVAVFIYDTTRDSDGGAWRKRCRHTSWYNETLSTATRGSRREFPQKALIVARAASVTIYDLDTASCPMWMVFNKSVGAIWTLAGYNTSSDISSISMLNGRIFVGASNTFGALIWQDFITDDVLNIHVSSNSSFVPKSIANRHLNVSPVISGTVKDIANRAVNAIDMAVLPGTPIDPVRGLPNPTIAVGTAGGVSVIHWDGRVCNSASTISLTQVQFSSDFTLFIRALGSALVRFSPLADYSLTGWSDRYYSNVSIPPVRALAVASALTTRGRNVVKGAADGLDFVFPEHGSGVSVLSQSNRSAIAYVTNTYNTGHMVGDIKLALAESTADLTSLAGSTPVDDSFDTYANDAALQASWAQTSASITLTGDGGVNVTPTGTYTGATKLFSGFVVGRRYKLTFAVRAGSANGRIYVNPSLNLASPLLASGSVAPGTYVFQFVATSTGMYVCLSAAVLSTTPIYEYVKIEMVGDDRSIAANHATVKGTITRAAVASGAELAAYGGFSAANYLEAPYASAFDFGTGNFAICGWLNLAANSAIETLIERDSGTTAQRWTMQVSAAGLPQWIVDDGTTTVTSAGTVAIDDARWHFVVAARRGANQELWIDGALVDSDTAPTLTLNNASAVLRVGESVAGGAPLTNGTLALLRIGATAPTPAQIRAIYEDERRLFAASAKCLLPGASVSALAYDDSTDLLHVATTAGSARLRGLLVVDKDATVYTGLDARDGILATRDSGSADIVLPSIPLREAAAAGIGHNGGPALYDRRTARAAGVTTNATPTVIARFPMDKGEFGQWVIRTVAREYDGGAELAAYEDVLLARRPGEGNIAISGSVTQRVIQEVTSSMAVSVAANTTTQCIEVTATGVSAKNIEWSVEARLA